MRAVAFIIALVLLMQAAPVLADVIHLKNGGRVEGEVEDRGDTYLVRLRTGSVTIRKSSVAGIERKPTLEQRYEVKRAETDTADPDALVTLGRWCRENGWEPQAKKEFAAALAIDPDHRGARSALGHIYYEGEWRTEPEIMDLKGFVKHDGEWMTTEEAAARKVAAKHERETRALEKRLNREFRRLAGSSDRKRERAYKDIVTLADTLENEDLKAFAAKAKAYYDEAWRIVRSQLGTMEIRAQFTKLKRPIPTISTTLGTGTPVKIQLPELSVVSVGTTVVVPLGGR